MPNGVWPGFSATAAASDISSSREKVAERCDVAKCSQGNAAASCSSTTADVRSDGRLACDSRRRTASAGIELEAEDVSAKGARVVQQIHVLGGRLTVRTQVAYEKRESSEHASAQTLKVHDCPCVAVPRFLFCLKAHIPGNSPDRVPAGKWPGIVR